MFDNTKPNIIILTDGIQMTKSLGPYRVATELRNAGFQVAVLNHLSCFTVDELKHILTNMISDRTLFVGVNNFLYASLGEENPGSFLPHNDSFNQEFKQLIKTANPNCKIVLGGPNATDQPHAKDFDFVVAGYAENSIVNLAQHLLDSSVTLKKSHKSVYGPVIVNDSKAEGFDFANSDTIYHDDDIILPGESLMLEIARGCIFSCSFCAFPLNGKKKLDYIRSKERIRDEMIRNYEKFQVTRYLFSDDTLNDSPEKCQMIYEISKSLPFKLEYWAYVRLDLLRAHPQTIEWLVESGLRAAFFGIETLNPRTAAAIGKGGNREQLVSVLRQIKEKYGDYINLHGSFIFGLPYEDLDSMKRTGDFLLSNENPLDSWGVQPLNIRPSNKSYTNDFLSDIDRNFSKYGYKCKANRTARRIGIDDARRSNTPVLLPPGNNSTLHPLGFMLWENEYTSWQVVDKLATALNREKMSRSDAKIKGETAFWYAGLGLPLDNFLNKSPSSINQSEVELAKRNKISEYKKKVFEQFKIPSIS